MNHDIIGGDEPNASPPATDGLGLLLKIGWKWGFYCNVRLGRDLVADIRAMREGLNREHWVNIPPIPIQTERNLEGCEYIVLADGEEVGCGEIDPEFLIHVDRIEYEYNVASAPQGYDLAGIEITAAGIFPRSEIRPDNLPADQELIDPAALIVLHLRELLLSRLRQARRAN